MIPLQTEYAGYLIRWDDFPKRFSILEKNGQEVTQKKFQSIAEAVEWIGNYNKASYKRVPVIAPDSPYGGGTMRPGEATSPVDGDHAWLSFTNPKTRCKLAMTRVWLDTPGNRRILDEVNAKQAQVKKLEAEAKALKELAVKLTLEDFKEEK